MIASYDAHKTFLQNFERTQMLLTAMEKIRAYNWLYQQKQYEVDLQFGKAVKEIQQKELTKIERSCTEHATISLTTAYETYLSELIISRIFQIKRNQIFSFNKCSFG